MTPSHNDIVHQNIAFLVLGIQSRQHYINITVNCNPNNLRKENNAVKYDVAEC